MIGRFQVFMSSHRSHRSISIMVDGVISKRLVGLLKGYSCLGTIFLRESSHKTAKNKYWSTGLEKDCTPKGQIILFEFFFKVELKFGYIIAHYTANQ